MCGSDRMSTLLPVNRRDCLNWGIGRSIHPIATALVCRSFRRAAVLSLAELGIGANFATAR
jgi:hypothetical protein